MNSATCKGSLGVLKHQYIIDAYGFGFLFGVHTIGVLNQAVWLLIAS